MATRRTARRGGSSRARPAASGATEPYPKAVILLLFLLLSLSSVASDYGYVFNVTQRFSQQTKLLTLIMKR
jgi:hypothetical protein